MADTKRQPNTNREQKLKKRYGISEADYNKLLTRQRGRCGICLRYRKLVVDHCHTKGGVRGLLCSNCNSALGLFEENPRFFAQAVQYLKLTKGER